MTTDGRFAHIYWVGGSPCAGKSTVVDRLAEQHGLTAYCCDDAWSRHCEAAHPDAQPLPSWASHATADEIWLRPVEQQVNEEIAIYAKSFR